MEEMEQTLADAQRLGHTVEFEAPGSLPLTAEGAPLVAPPAVPSAFATETEPAYKSFEGGAYDVSLPADAPIKLHLFGSLEVAPGGEPRTIHLPAGDAGEHQLLDLQRHYTVEPTKPKTVTPDPRMTATAK